MAGEFALVAVDRNEVEERASEGSALAASTVRALKTLSFQLSGAQLGITISSLLLGIVAEPVFAEILHPIFGSTSDTGVAAAVGITIATILQMVIGELTPKTYAISRPLPTALAVGPPMRWVNAVARPLIALFNGAANMTLRMLGIEPREELRRGRSLEELELVMRASAEEGTLGEEEFALVARSFDFSDKTAHDVLVPRTAVVALARDALVPHLVATSIESGHSRFPVFRDDVDDIVGIVHVKDAYRVPPQDRAVTNVAMILNPVYTVPQTIALSALLVELRVRGQQMAVVVDEYGGTAGLITMEDVLEEIVGDIEDEYDTGELQIGGSAPHDGGPGVWRVAGMAHRDELRAACGFEIPEGEWETLAGFLLHVFEHIPTVGERAVYDGWTFEVLDVDRRRIAAVGITAPAAESGTDGHGERGAP